MNNCFYAMLKKLNFYPSSLTLKGQSRGKVYEIIICTARWPHQLFPWALERLRNIGNLQIQPYSLNSSKIGKLFNYTAQGYLFFRNYSIETCVV
jgi:hypothetical protein